MRLPVAMDFAKIRKTEHGKVIAQVKQCTQHYAAKLYRRLLGEERAPQCEVRDIQKGANGDVYQ